MRDAVETTDAHTLVPVAPRTIAGRDSALNRRGGNVRRCLIILVVLGAIGVSTACSTPNTTAPVTATADTATAPVAVRQLDPAEFAVATAGPRVSVNVHIPNEGSLPGTDLTIPFDHIAARAAELPQDRTTPVAVYCMTGHMSAIAGQELIRLGYTDIVELRGGMQAWKADGRPLLPATEH